MDKKKILLGSKDYVLRNDEDVFLNVELMRTINEIKPNNVENAFNLSNQYIKERNESLKFCVYGIVESKYADCTNLVLNIKTDGNDIMYLPKKTDGSINKIIHKIPTIALSENGKLSKNIFDKDKASYSFMFEIDRNKFESDIQKIIDAGGIPKNKNLIITINDETKKLFDVFEVPFIFFDQEGNFIDYGTQTSEIDLSGNTFETNNDFPFFYDRHWIKSNFNVSKLGSLFFPYENNTTQVLENIISGKASINVSLDYPSKFGREEATVVLEADNTVRNPSEDFIFSNQTIKWKTGEKEKSFEITILNDRFVENIETLSFKLSDIKNAQILEGGLNQLSLEIKDDDIPSHVNFKTQQQTLSETAGTISIEVFLDKPVDVEGQSIELTINTTGTTAIIEDDFSMDVPEEPLANSKTLYFDKGVTGLTTTITLKEDFKYEPDKFILLEFKNPTQNLAIGTQVYTHKIIIKDSIIKKYATYTIPFDENRGTGIFRANRKTSDDRYKWMLSSSEDSFNRNFPFSLVVENSGVDIVVDDKVYTSGDTVFVATFKSGITSAITINLPSNYTPNTQEKSYDGARYNFVFKNIANGLDISEVGPIIFTQNKYLDTSALVETKLAGKLGEKNYRLVSELSNIYSRYDNSNNTCSAQITSELNNIKINGAVFLPVSNSFNLNPISSVKLLFDKKPIEHHCDISSNILPFGFYSAGEPPFNEKYAEFAFRDLFVQISGQKLSSNSKIAVEKSAFTNDESGFFEWKDSVFTSADFKLRITNNGAREVDVFEKVIREGATETFTNNDVSLNNLILRLEANTGYVLSSNTYDSASYSISIDIRFFNKKGIFEGVEKTFSIQPFSFSASTELNGIPRYFLVSKYDEANVTSTQTGIPNCDGLFFNVSKDISVRGMLFVNSKTDFMNAYFVEQKDDMVPTCPTNKIQYKILN